MFAVPQATTLATRSALVQTCRVWVTRPNGCPVAKNCGSDGASPADAGRVMCAGIGFADMSEQRFSPSHINGHPAADGCAHRLGRLAGLWMKRGVRPCDVERPLAVQLSVIGRGRSRVSCLFRCNRWTFVWLIDCWNSHAGSRAGQSIHGSRCAVDRHVPS